MEMHSSTLTLAFGMHYTGNHQNNQQRAMNHWGTGHTLKSEQKSLVMSPKLHKSVAGFVIQVPACRG
jgi:hypothetical protein